MEIRERKNANNSTVVEEDDLCPTKVVNILARLGDLQKFGSFYRLSFA
jgi:hypothetical protein